MEAQNVALAGVLGDDIKHVLALQGLNMTGVTMTFELSAGPEQPPIATGSCSLLSVATEDDGVVTSVIQVFVASATVRSAVTGVGGLPGNEPLPLFYQLKFNKLPGDLGSDAVTTILFGEYLMKGEVNG